MNQLTPSTIRERLYPLLPAIYRQRDFFLEEPLRALLAIVEGELGLLEADINNLYENWFIETCDEWVLPYIAELVGIRDLNDAGKIFPVQRSRIGNAIRYRRHKGTPRTLELAIENTTGWTVRVVEMFKYVFTTQYIQRIRPDAAATFDMTRSTQMVAMGDYFDNNAHTLDIRAFDINRIRYNLKSLSLFIWRLQSYPVKGSTPCYRQELPVKTFHLRGWQKDDDDSKYEFERAVFGFNTLPSQRKHTVQVSPRPISNENNYYKYAIEGKKRDPQPGINQTGCYSFHPLGYDMPLFNCPRARENMWAHSLDSRELPMAISHDAFSKDLTPSDPPPEKKFDEKFIKIFKLSGDRQDFVYPNDIVEAETSNTTYSLSGENVYRKSVELKEVPVPRVEKPEIKWNSEYYYGPDRMVGIYIRRGKDGEEFLPVEPAKIQAKKLINWEPPPAGKIAIDVELGRLMFASGEDPGWDNIQVDFSYGFSGNMGGGPYNRNASMSVETKNIWWVGKNRGSNAVRWYDTLPAAIAAWRESGEAHGTIRIADNQAHFNARTHSGMPIVGQTLPIELKECDSLTIEAGNGYNPSISPLGGDIVIVAGQKEAKLRLNGLLCGGTIAVGNVKLEVDNCTVRPQQKYGKQASIVGTTARCYDREVQISSSIVGQVNLPASSRELVVSDSIIDGVGWAAISSSEEKFGPLTKIARSTILGRVYTREMALGSETIFVEPVTVETKERGSMRYSYAPLGDKIIERSVPKKEKIYYYQTPERYKCQPDPQKWETDRGPSFTAQQYGQPGYGQLNLSCPEKIQKGEGNGAEMGAFNNGKRPQRELNLEASLEEYLRLGLEVNKIYKN